jgi:hypothetical protein
MNPMMETSGANAPPTIDLVQYAVSSANDHTAKIELLFFIGVDEGY